MQLKNIILGLLLLFSFDSYAVHSAPTTNLLESKKSFWEQLDIKHKKQLAKTFVLRHSKLLNFNRESPNYVLIIAGIGTFLSGFLNLIIPMMYFSTFDVTDNLNTIELTKLIIMTVYFLGGIAICLIGLFIFFRGLIPSM